MAQTVTRDMIPDFLRPLVNSDVDLKLAQDCVNAIQNYFTQTKRTIDAKDALELLSLVPDSDLPTKLAEFGFGFNDQGQFRQLRNGVILLI